MAVGRADINGLLGLLEPTLARQLDERLHYLRVRKGQVVLEHGSRSRDVYFLIEGELQVLLYSVDGKEVSVRRLLAGDLFGELAAIDGLPRSATVTATAPSRLAAMRREDFQLCISTSPKAALWIARQFAAQIRTLTHKIFELSALNVRNRLNCELLRLALMAGVEENQAVINPAPTHAELANRIGAQREAVTRELRDLAARKIVQQNRRQIEIVDFKQLSRIVQRLSAQGAGIYAAPPKSADNSGIVQLELQAG